MTCLLLQSFQHPDLLAIYSILTSQLSVSYIDVNRLTRESESPAASQTDPPKSASPTDTRGLGVRYPSSWERRILMWRDENVLKL